MNQGPQYKIIEGHGVVALEKTQQILLFGGNEGNLWNGYINSMWICNRDTNNNYQWKRLLCNMPTPTEFFGYILTKDERYIIIIGGRTQKGLINDIYVLDLLKWKWIKKEKTAPKKAMYHACIDESNFIHLFEINSTNHYKLRLSCIITEESIIQQTDYKQNQQDIEKQDLILSQKSLIKSLQLALQETKGKLLLALQENEELKEENATLRNNITRSLEKVIEVTPTGSDKTTKGRRFGESQKLLRKLQRSDTFLLLSDEDFESDEEFEDESDEKEQEQDEEEEDQDEESEDEDQENVEA